MLQNLEEQARRLTPIMTEIQPAEWIAQGAPQAYVEQWTHTKADLQYLLDDNAALVKKPERLSLALDTYFRIVGEAGESLGECKLIVVGRGGAGKTSLVKRLSGLPYDPNERGKYERCEKSSIFHRFL